MNRSFSHLLLLLSLSATPALSRAAPLTRDLGEGLAYHRITTLPADLPTTEAARKQPCVLDLRYARGAAAAGTALDAWLKFHATARTPVFLLVNADTAAALLAPLAARLPASGLVILGTPSPALTPDLVLKISPADERRAYDALAAGTPVEALLNDTPEKPRNDEARLAKDRQSPPANAPDAADDSLVDLILPVAIAEKSPPPKPPAPLIDAALQRAVQLHRSLKALKKL